MADFLTVAVADERIERVSVFSSPSALRRFDFPRSSKLYDVPQATAEHNYASRMLWYERLLERACKEVGADAVICMNGMGVVRSLPQVTFMQQSLPFSQEALATLPSSGRVRMRAVRTMMGRSCRNASGIVTQTPTMALWVEMAFGLRKMPFEPITPTISMGKQTPMPGKLRRRIERVPPGRRVFYVGNDSPYKQLPVLLEAFESVHTTLDDAVLFMVGPTPPARCGCDGVEYLGFVDYEHIGAIYEAADLLLLPALVESCPMPMLEAMWSGLPVLAADRPYAHDVSQGAVRYFNPFDPLDLAAKIQGLLADSSLRREMSEQGRRRYEDITAAQPYQKMIDAVVRWAKI